MCMMHICVKFKTLIILPKVGAMVSVVYFVEQCFFLAFLLHFSFLVLYEIHCKIVVCFVERYK